MQQISSQSTKQTSSGASSPAGGGGGGGLGSDSEAKLTVSITTSEREAIIKQYGFKNFNDVTRKLNDIKNERKGYRTQLDLFQKNFEETRSGCKSQESLREKTVRMQTPGKTSGKHGQDANRWTSPKPLHSAFSNVSLHPTHVFTRILGHGSLTLAPPALNSTRVFSAISSGGQFLGSRGETPPSGLTF